MLEHAVEGYEFKPREWPVKRIAREDWATRDLIIKRPLDIFYFQFPGPRILMIRDPRSVITSIHWSTPDQYFCGADETVAGTPGVIRQWNAIKEHRKNPKNIVVHYEDLVSNPSMIEARIQSRFNFQYKARFADFHEGEMSEWKEKAMNGVRPLDSGHDWRDHMDRVEQQLQQFPALQTVIEEAGYA